VLNGTMSAVKHTGLPGALVLGAPGSGPPRGYG